MLDILRVEDVRNVILAANAAEGDVAGQYFGHVESTGQEHRQAYQAGYEAALVAIAQAFGIPLRSGGQLRAPGVAIPGGRLAVSYRAEQSLLRLMQQREEFNP